MWKMMEFQKNKKANTMKEQSIHQKMDELFHFVRDLNS
jgi:hypothetical protein